MQGFVSFGTIRHAWARLNIADSISTTIVSRCGVRRSRSCSAATCSQGNDSAGTLPNAGRMNFLNKRCMALTVWGL